MNNSNPYPLIHFLDHILKIDENGDFIPKRDKEGNVIINKVTGRPEFVAEQEGTRLNARNMNHLDTWLFRAHEILVQHANEILRMQINQEINDKFPGNSGAFADLFDGEPNKIQRLTARAVLTAPRSAGTTVLNVDHTEGFKPFTEVSIFDGVNFENKLITEITQNTITVQPLENDYVKGAAIARSTAKIEAGKMENGAWSTYTIEVGEVV